MPARLPSMPIMPIHRGVCCGCGTSRGQHYAKSGKRYCSRCDIQRMRREIDRDAKLMAIVLVFAAIGGIALVLAAAFR